MQKRRERWKIVIGHTRYMISNWGFVKSMIGSNKILKPCYNQDGYLKLRLDGIQYFVARLVALHFVKNPMNKPQVNHKNGVKDDNYYKNLSWMTPSENVAHAYANGLSKSRKGVFKHTEATKQKVRLKKFQPLRINGIEYKSFEHAAKKLKLHRCTLSRWVHSGNVIKLKQYA